MRSSLLVRLVPVCGLLLMTGVLSTAAPAARAVRRAFLPEFRAQIQKDPSLAPQLLREFWENASNQKVDVLIENSIEATRILWRADRSQTDAALNLLDMTFQRFPRTRTRYLTIEAKAEILRRSDRLDEAAQLLQSVWPQVQSRNIDPVMTPILSEWVEVLREQKKPQQAIELLYEALQTAPSLANWMNFYRLMFDAQTDAGHSQEALQWVGLFFRVAPYKDDDIAHSTSLVTRAWLGDAGQMGKPALFAAAQSNADAPNPLQEVALPRLPAPVKAVLQARLKSEDDREAAASRVAMAIVLGDTRAAMLEAREILLSNPTGVAGTGEVARVFKATDGDVARANQFLAFYRTGKGSNPLVEFLSEETPREVTP